MTNSSNQKYSFVAVIVSIAILSLLHRIYPHMQETSRMTAKTQSSNVVIVGAGLAGLSAAWSALDAGARSVLVFERTSEPGGNSVKASSGINGAPTRFQKSTSPDYMFYSDTVNSAGKRLLCPEPEKRRRQDLIKLLTDESAAAIEFLADTIGVDLSVVVQLGGHSVPRTHRGAGRAPPGTDIVGKLLNKLRSNNRFQLKINCEVTKLLMLPSQQDISGTYVSGVQYRCDDQLESVDGSVIFATGGFAGDTTGILAWHRPDLVGLPSTNDPRPGMHGLLTEVGAQLVDMDSVQIHPTGFIDPGNDLLPVKFLAPEFLRGNGGILLHQGRRFVNEMETREHVSRAIMGLEVQSEEPKQWNIKLVLDPGVCRASMPHVAFYLWKGLLKKAKISDLDKETRLTIQNYSLVTAGQQKDIFGRETFGSWSLKGNEQAFENEVVCVGTVTPVTHFTMGGVAINGNSEVLSQVQEPIYGLWAAGEVTGGLHGDNRLGGSSLLECVVFGRIAGARATEHTLQTCGDLD